MADAAQHPGVAVAKGKGRHRGGKKEIERLVIKKGANGGHVITHDYKRPNTKEYVPAPESEDFPFGEDEGQAALQHIATHMGMTKQAASGGAPAEATEGDEEEADA